MTIVKNPIGPRLIRNIILISTFFSIIATGIQLYTDYISETDKIHERLLQVKSSSLENIRINLWQDNNELIQLQLENLLSFPDITYVSIEKDGKPLYHFGTDEGDDSITQRYPLTYVYNNREYELGVLHLQASLGQVREKVKERFYLIAITQTVKTFIVAFIILYMFTYMICRHLFKIAEYAHKMTYDLSDTAPLHLDLKTRDDELSLVEEALNTLHTTLISRLKKTENERTELGKINDLLEKRIALSENPDNDTVVLKKDLDELKNLIHLIHDANNSKDYGIEERKSDIKTLALVLEKVLKKA
jgi:hypothetical protein